VDFIKQHYFVCEYIATSLLISDFHQSGQGLVANDGAKAATCRGITDGTQRSQWHGFSWVLLSKRFA
jgi:hypothetical protein